jgi:hemerythrin
MARIQWDDSLSVGVGLIDDQHKQLIRRLDDLARAVEENQGPKAVATTLSFLTDYTHFHFSAEEGLMLAQEYPRLDEHRALHEEFRTVLKSLDVDFETDGASTFLADQINRFLITWLTNHIGKADREVWQFLHSRNNTLQ